MQDAAPTVSREVVGAAAKQYVADDDDEMKEAVAELIANDLKTYDTDGSLFDAAVQAVMQEQHDHVLQAAAERLKQTDSDDIKEFAATKLAGAQLNKQGDEYQAILKAAAEDAEFDKATLRSRAVKTMIEEDDGCLAELAVDKIFKDKSNHKKLERRAVNRLIREDMGALRDEAIEELATSIYHKLCDPDERDGLAHIIEKVAENLSVQRQVACIKIQREHENAAGSSGD